VKARALGQNLALALGTIVLALGPAELVLRRLAPVRTRFYEFDERLVYRPRPGAEQTFTYPHLDREQTVTLRFNRQGYRGDDLTPGRARRVAVFGDSFVEARLTRLERTFPVRLAARLGQALGTPMDAVNAGVSGYGPDQAVLRIERELPALAPQLVVVVLYAGNDGGDLVRNGLFRLEGERLVDNAWRVDEEMQREMAPSRGVGGLALARALGRARRWASLLTKPSLPPASIEAALVACREEFARRRHEPWRVQDLQHDHYDADLGLEPGSEAAEYKRRILRAVMARMRDTAAAAHAPLMLVFVPHPTDACRNWSPQVDTGRFPGYRRSTLTDVLAQAAQSEGIPFVDLFAPFWERGGDAFYFPRDGHWNIEGQDLAAQLAAERVLAEGWLR
jgi:lysophospholipase L1-like esterase